jgi:hypothetical protein
MGKMNGHAVNYSLDLKSAEKCFARCDATWGITGLPELSKSNEEEAKPFLAIMAIPAVQSLPNSLWDCNRSEKFDVNPV